MSKSIRPLDRVDWYAAKVEKSRFAAGSAAQYVRQVRAFCEWLEARWDDYEGALDDEHRRDWAVTDYKQYLQDKQNRSIATVESHMSAIFSFYDMLGMGKPRITRQSPRKGAPKGLDDKQLLRVLRECKARGERDAAIGALLFGCAIRVGEAAALNTDDVLVTDRRGLVDVRWGKGGFRREVPIPVEQRPLLRPWIERRAAQLHKNNEPVGPLFTSRTGGRLSKRQMQRIVEEVGDAAGVDLSPHMLRHTFAQKFLDNGGNIGELQEILGHKNLTSTQVYLRPTRDKLAESADRVRIGL